MPSISERLSSVLTKISKSAEKSRRKTEDIILVGVTKGIPANQIEEGIRCGILNIGENRVQETRDKKPQVSNANLAIWHLVGHLQSNKVKLACELFDVIQSVDSVSLCLEIARRSKEKAKGMEVLLEVNTSGEKTKFGFSPNDILECAKRISEIEGINVLGLMTVGIFSNDEDKIRDCFKRLKSLKSEIDSRKIFGEKFYHLSMGMSHDYEIAIEEGATMVRIGTAIFGERK